MATVTRTSHWLGVGRGGGGQEGLRGEVAGSGTSPTSSAAREHRKVEPVVGCELRAASGKTALTSVWPPQDAKQP